MKNREDVLLIFPPQWTPIQPYLSLPSLFSYLKERKVSVSQHDLNMDFYDTLLSGDYLLPMCQTLKRVYQKLNNRASLRLEEQEYYYSIFLVKDSLNELLSSIEDIKNFFRSKDRFFDLKEMSIQRSRLNIALNVINIYCSIKLGFDDLDFPINIQSYQEISSLIFNGEKRFIIQFFRNQMENLLTSKECLLVGISINNSSQLIPALAMSSWIKIHRPEIHVTLGGNLLSRCYQALKKFPDFFSNFADSIILFEGEKPLFELISAIKYGIDLEVVHSLVFMDKNQNIFQTKNQPPMDINELPTPNFDGLPLEKYFSPYLILPLLASRGCYWGKCTFCDHSFIYNKGFQQREAEKVVNDLNILREKYDTKYFSFSDEALSPSAARKISEKIIENNLDVSLLANARLETTFSNEICQLMARAGMKMLFIGLESACKRVLNRINKGIDIGQSTKILKRFHKNDILIHFFIIFGFPGETPEEAQETSNFVLKNEDVLFSVGASVFQVGRYSPIAINPVKYGISIYSHPSTSPFSYICDFDYVTGQSHQSVKDLQDNFMQLARKKLKFGTIWSKMLREQIFLYAFKYTEKELMEVAHQYKEFEKDLHHSVEEKKAISKDLFPCLKKGIFLNEVNFNIPKIQENLKKGCKTVIEPEVTYLLYNSSTQSSIRITPDGYCIIFLCDGNYSVDDIIIRLNSFYNTDQSDIKERVISFLNKMRERNLIDLLKVPQI